MDIARASSQNSLMDVLDRVLDKGVVIDAWVRLSLVAIDLITMKTDVVIASIETYLPHSAGPADVESTARSRGEGRGLAAKLAKGGLRHQAEEAIPGGTHSIYGKAPAATEEHTATRSSAAKRTE